MITFWLTLDWLIQLLLVILSVSTALHALMNKNDPRSSLLWIITCFAVPFAGPILYLVLGINRAHDKVLSLGAVADTSLSTIPKTIAPLHKKDSHLSSHQRLSLAVTGLSSTEGNQIQILSDGENAYPAMLNSINEASQWIYLSMYIFEYKGIGEQFIDALANAVERGVDVRVLLDGIGSWYSLGQTKKILTARGVRTLTFLPIGKMLPRLTLNLRNHRKILLCDGQHAFTGGMNIRQCHLVQTSQPNRATKDYMFSLKGPIAKQMGKAFEDDWFYACGERLPIKQYDLNPYGTSSCRVISDGPGVNLNVLTKVMISAINSAQLSITLVTPYFLPPNELIIALQSAALRGVEVSVLLPAHNNQPSIHWAMRNNMRHFLAYGVKIYYQPRPFVHSKLLLIDNNYCQIGSANIDSRSLRLNFELNVEIFDADFGQSMAKIISDDKQQAVEVTQQELNKRPFVIRTWDAFWWLFTPYL
jgi:cardiolipin synthase